MFRTGWDMKSKYLDSFYTVWLLEHRTATEDVPESVMKSATVPQPEPKKRKAVK
jgi:hypothetical protein